MLSAHPLRARDKPDTLNATRSTGPDCSTHSAHPTDAHASHARPNTRRGPRRNPRPTTSGFSLIEVLVAAVIITLLLATFARMSVQSERNTTTLNAATLTADTANLIGVEVRSGNSSVIPTSGTQPLSTSVLAALTPSDGQRAQITSSGLTGTVTALGGNPPLYRITTEAAGTRTVIDTIGPGGSD